jgi:hypothetical protein
MLVSAPCVQCARQCPAVQLVVCSVCGGVAVGGSAAICSSVHSSVWQSVAVRVAVCGSALGKCVAVRQCV